MKTKWNGGYMGILMILLSVAIIAFIVWRTDLFRGKQGEGQIEDDVNMIEQGNTAIDSANQVKNLLEQNNVKALE